MCGKTGKIEAQLVQTPLLSRGASHQKQSVIEHSSESFGKLVNRRRLHRMNGPLSGGHDTYREVLCVDERIHSPYCFISFINPDLADKGAVAGFGKPRKDTIVKARTWAHRTQRIVGHRGNPTRMS